MRMLRVHKKAVQVGNLEPSVIKHYCTSGFPLAHTCGQIREWVSLMTSGLRSK